ncbi:MAG: GNAT family N-acetyltransferase [Burkholderiales bacterium]|nr:GNAT family N-acetyltransferase [Burkholderiales bacterium]
MSIWIEPFELHGEYVSLVPLTMEYHEQLREALADGELWNLWYTSIPRPENLAAEIERRLALQAKGEMVPFAVIDKRTKQAVGMTTYCRLDQANRRLEIGYTWYRQNCQRTALNTECKLMLLRHAFEVLNCASVEFRTSAFNFTSRKAIERLGAKLDGVLRNTRIFSNGAIGDSYVYSILNNEWPIVKTNLEYKLRR